MRWSKKEKKNTKSKTHANKRDELTNTVVKRSLRSDSRLVNNHTNSINAPQHASLNKVEHCHSPQRAERQQLCRMLRLSFSLCISRAQHAKRNADDSSWHAYSK